MKIFHFLLLSEKIDGHLPLPPFLDARQTSFSISRAPFEKDQGNRVDWPPQPSANSSFSTSNQLADAIICNLFIGRPSRRRPRPRPRGRRRGSFPMARSFLRGPGFGEERLVVVWR